MATTTATPPTPAAARRSASARRASTRRRSSRRGCRARRSRRSTCAHSVLRGFNVCILAYGQTGSGKTFTMEGKRNDDQLAGHQPARARPPLRSDRERRQLELAAARRTRRLVVVRRQVSYLEIYNEKPERPPREGGREEGARAQALRVGRDRRRRQEPHAGEGGPRPPRCSGRCSEGRRRSRRSASATTMNATSSRSHSPSCTVHVHGRNSRRRGDDDGQAEPRRPRRLGAREEVAGGRAAG